MNQVLLIGRITKDIDLKYKGRIQTGSYEKNGQTVYTTDVVANHIEYLTYGKGEGENY